jgi:hypothetical protein
MKKILYIGDSYCATYSYNHTERVDDQHHQGVVITDNLVSHLNVAANLLNTEFIPFGYAGKSWYYSRSRFLKYFDEHPELLEQTEAVVFFHTDAYRYNTVNLHISTNLMSDIKDRLPEELMYVEPYRAWLKYLMDPNFQTWAQTQWFHEINIIFSKVNKIHFCNFDNVIDRSKVLEGMTFVTPLFDLCLGEMEGTDQEILAKLDSNDSRANHLNEHNNKELGKLVANAVNNYLPGRYPIDTSTFYLPNKNAHKWPYPGFGSV